MRELGAMIDLGRLPPWKGIHKEAEHLAEEMHRRLAEAQEAERLDKEFWTEQFEYRGEKEEE